MILHNFIIHVNKSGLESGLEPEKNCTKIARARMLFALYFKTSVRHG